MKNDISKVREGRQVGGPLEVDGEVGVYKVIGCEARAVLREELEGGRATKYAKAAKQSITYRLISQRKEKKEKKKYVDEMIGSCRQVIR